MLTGINANIQHSGATYHIQTEDGGIENPTITTLLFKEGAICSSKKTNYKELLQTDSFEETVKRLMETQHREMIQELCGEEVKQSVPPQAPSQIPAQEQIESSSAAATQEKPREATERKRKGLDDLIQDYLADKQTGRD